MQHVYGRHQGKKESPPNNCMEAEAAWFREKLLLAAAQVKHEKASLLILEKRRFSSSLMGVQKKTKCEWKTEFESLSSSVLLLSTCLKINYAGRGGTCAQLGITLWRINRLDKEKSGAICFHKGLRWLVHLCYPKRTDWKTCSVPCPRLVALYPPHYWLPKVGCSVVRPKSPADANCARPASRMMRCT